MKPKQEKRHLTIADTFEQLQRPVGTLKVRDGDSYSQEIDKASYYRDLLTVSDTDLMLIKFKRIESALTNLFDEHRRDKSWIVDFCSSGPSVAAPAIVQSMVELNEQCILIVEKALLPALEVKLLTRRWSITRKIIDIFQIVLKSTSVADGVKAQVRL